MGIVVSFTDYRPVPRYDNTSWTQVLIEESASRDGEFATISTFNIDPDADPTNPEARSFTTFDATLDTGWYRVVFKDADGNTQATTPILNGQTTPDYLPSVGEVAALMITRTFDETGALVGAFTAHTRPTAEQVADIINLSAQTIIATVGVTIPDQALTVARSVIALRSAMKVELTFFSEQIGTQKSAFDSMRDMYKDEVVALKLAVVEMDPDNGGGGEAFEPEYSFDDPAGWDNMRW